MNLELMNGRAGYPRSFWGAVPHLLMATSAAMGLLLAATGSASAQSPNIRYGEVVPRDVREMYERGLSYMVSTQSQAGDWASAQYYNGAGVTGLGIMVFLASGEDPNFGMYSSNIRRALRHLISSQDASTGIFPSSMYHHGFAMLALSEAYGAVDDRQLWAGVQGGEKRSIGESLELAVRAAITSQKKNQSGAWRYTPDSSDADTSVAGAVLVGLLAARNAGIEIPDTVIDKAIMYYKQMTTMSGTVAYEGIGSMDSSTARVSIAALVFALARRKDLPQYKATVDHLKNALEQPGHGYTEYTHYYEAQALFQGDVDAWEKWNKLLVRDLKAKQRPDGSFASGSMPGATGTSLSLLGLALNFRFLPIYER